MGLLTITPRDEKGNPISPDKLVNFVVKDKDGTPVKEWFAIASYLKEMDGEMDEKYSETDGRKVVYSSLKPADLLRNANKFTYILIVVIIVLIAVIVLIILAIIRKVKRSKIKKAKALEEARAAADKAALANAIEEEYNSADVKEDNESQADEVGGNETLEMKTEDEPSDGFDY